MMIDRNKVKSNSIIIFKHLEDGYVESHPPNLFGRVHCVMH